MIDRDFFSEVWQTIIKQRWRSVMTAFGVFWGILILAVLIGAGKGLQNGLYASYQTIPPKSIVLITSPTMLSYSGLETGRTWNVTVSDIERLRKSFSSEIKEVAVLNIANDRVPVSARYGNSVSDFVLAGEQPQSLAGLPQKIIKGRFINELDMIQCRNVCVIGESVADKLFGTESPLGKELVVDEKTYTVVGVGKRSSNKINIGFDLSEGIVIPLNLMQLSYNHGETIHLCNFILYDEADAGKLIASMDPLIRKWHSIHPDDSSALRLINWEEQSKQISAIFGGINFLVWIVGIGTLLAGLIGISNIMLISVKERTKEIGIRTSMGAQPQSIVGQIMCESMVLTALSGIVGLCFGVGILALLNTLMGEGGESFTHPHIPFWTGISALLILISGGLIAGFIPARRALKIELVKALSDE